MARFDVYSFPSTQTPLVVDVQANILSDLSTRVVVPLVELARVKREPLPRLKPVINIHGTQYVFQATEIAPVPASALRKCVANIEAEYRTEITAALDFLFQGF